MSNPFKINDIVFVERDPSGYYKIVGFKMDHDFCIIHKLNDKTFLPQRISTDGRQEVAILPYWTLKVPEKGKLPEMIRILYTDV
jgi:hypothetical protein